MRLQSLDSKLSTYTVKMNLPWSFRDDIKNVLTCPNNSYEPCEESFKKVKIKGKRGNNSNSSWKSFAFAFNMSSISKNKNNKLKGKITSFLHPDIRNDKTENLN